MVGTGKRCGSCEGGGDCPRKIVRSGGIQFEKPEETGCDGDCATKEQMEIRELMTELSDYRRFCAYQTQRLTRSVYFITEILQATARKEAKEARAKHALDCQRLGNPLLDKNVSDCPALCDLKEKHVRLTATMMSLEERNKRLLAFCNNSRDEGNESSFDDSERDSAENLEKTRLQMAKCEREAEALCQAMRKVEQERYLHYRESRRISFEDRSKFRNNPVFCDRFLLLSLLGKGGYSEVFQAFDLKELKYVAFKIQELEAVEEAHKEDQQRRIKRECNIHKILDHRHIVKQFDNFWVNEDLCCTVMEYCTGRDLDFYIKQNGRIPESEARMLVMQMASALKYLNEIKPSVIHYDLKPANVLLNGDGILDNVKIADFGVSKIVDEQNYDPIRGMDLTSQGAGTYWYLPPETFVSEDPKISSKVDVWSLGVIFYQCLYGKKPFAQDQDQTTIMKEKTILKAGAVEFPEDPVISAAAKGFLKACLQPNPENRLDVFQMANHPYLQQTLNTTILQNLESNDCVV
ncbi:unnamed protein product [Notodromas monacha]|uniref:Protein kinase domain-containing protein n=1 Tax=Notodromas monacha TaxID=399045 RepID=A0A7R9BK98_9CRUS|nr:unnamed protein product [Notodromas monacha]CAG0915713.1 unnamed protein product [Notodromas monacha]